MKDTYLIRLRECVEQKVGRKLQTPKDFDYLRDIIFSECHEMVSSSTLKRIWGYNKDGGTPRLSSLNPLAKLIGYEDLQGFLQAEGLAEEVEGIQDDHPTGNKRKYIAFMVLSVVIALGGLMVYHYFSSSENDSADELAVANTPSGQRVLRKGEECFHSIEDYLPLFGIEYGDTAYFRPVPNLEQVFVWSPEYGHPIWHNEGDKSELMPTITEYWTPIEGAKNYQNAEYVKLANEKLYFERAVRDELRITFMKGIVDSLYVYIGIYRMDREHSTPEKFVWKRVADDCDLGALDKLPLLRRLQ